MTCESRVTVVFPDTGEKIEAEEIRPEEIKNGDTCLVSQSHNADLILRVPQSQQPLPKGPWKREE